MKVNALGFADTRMFNISDKMIMSGIILSIAGGLIAISGKILNSKSSGWIFTLNNERCECAEQIYEKLYAPLFKK